jgi:hypothetical protein
MGPKLAIAPPANLPDCAGNSPITQPDADPWMTGRKRPEQPVGNVHETMGVSLWGTQVFSFPALPVPDWERGAYKVAIVICRPSLLTIVAGAQCSLRRWALLENSLA